MANSTMGIRNFIYEEVKLEGGGEISLNQSLIYEHIFPHSRHILFVYPSSTMQPKKKLFLGTKIMGGDFPTLPPPQVTPMTATIPICVASYVTRLGSSFVSIKKINPRMLFRKINVPTRIIPVNYTLCGVHSSAVRSRVNGQLGEPITQWEGQRISEERKTQLHPVGQITKLNKTVYLVTAMLLWVN